MIVSCDQCRSDVSIPDSPRVGGYYVCGRCKSPLKLPSTVGNGIDWSSALRQIGIVVDRIAKEVLAAGKPDHRTKMANRRLPNKKQCLFWNCRKPINPDHYLCYEHYTDFRDGLVDECPDCHLAKLVDYDLCLDCFRTAKKTTGRRTERPKTGNSWYKREYSPAWAKGDAKATDFYVYILKLDDSSYYAGQTRELRERLSEHRDGKTASTKGRTPKLVWFAVVPTRDAATKAEVLLKKLVDQNPREIRRMIIKFGDLVGELDDS